MTDLGFPIGIHFIRHLRSDHGWSWNRIRSEFRFMWYSNHIGWRVFKEMVEGSD